MARIHLEESRGSWGRDSSGLADAPLMANFGCIELIPWGSQVGSLDREAGVPRFRGWKGCAAPDTSSLALNSGYGSYQAGPGSGLYI